MNSEQALSEAERLLSAAGVAANSQFEKSHSKANALSRVAEQYIELAKIKSWNEMS